MNDAVPATIRTFQPAGSDGLGNVLLEVEEGQAHYLLKLYRRHFSRWQEIIEPVGARLLLGTTGRDAQSRYANEQRCLALWAREGFDVPQIFPDKPLPKGVEPPALWMTFYPGELLSAAIADPARAWKEKRSLLRQLGDAMGRRHRRALETQQPLLCQKHGSIIHILLCEGRLLSFDLEGSFRPGFPVIEALTQELSGVLRSIAKRTGDRTDDAFRAFVEGYPDRGLLREIAHWGVHGKTLRRRLTRWQDRRRRKHQGKTAVLAQLLELL